MVVVANLPHLLWRNSKTNAAKREICAEHRHSQAPDGMPICKMRHILIGRYMYIGILHI